MSVNNFQALTPESQDSPSQGFRSFWRKTKQTSKGTNGSTAKNKSKTGRTNAPQSGIAKRREQVNEAQKRHRDRKAEYLQSLEKEVSRLRRLVSQLNNEKNNSQRNVLALQNGSFLDTFASPMVPEPFSETTSDAWSTPNFPGSLDIDVRFDSDIGRERIFLNRDDVDESQYFTSPSAFSQTASTTPTHRRNEDISSAALDFILALEWPCQSHHAHELPVTPVSDTITPLTQANVADYNQLHGHCFTMTAAMYGSAQPICHEPNLMELTPPASVSDVPSKPSFQIPHSEIEKLVHLSESLEVDEDQATPAQAYAYIKRLTLSDDHLRTVLGRLKPILSAASTCKGFGAVIPTSLVVEKANVVVLGTL